MKTTRWKGAVEKGLLKEPLKKQLINRLEQSGLDFAHGWVHEEDGSIHVVKNADNIIADVVYGEGEIPEISAPSGQIRYVWLEFTNLMVDCYRYPYKYPASYANKYPNLSAPSLWPEYWAYTRDGIFPLPEGRREWGLSPPLLGQMFNGLFNPIYRDCRIRIIEQPIYILFIEQNGVLKLVGAFSSIDYPDYTWFNTNLPVYNEYSKYLSVSSKSFNGLCWAALLYVKSLHPQHPHTSYLWTLTSDVIIDQENPFNLMYIFSLCAVEWTVVGDVDYHYYYYYNIGIPVTLVRDGASMFSPLTAIAYNFIFLDSPHVQLCKYYPEERVIYCEGRDEYNPSFELVDGVVYRTRAFYASNPHRSFPHNIVLKWEYPRHVVKTLKNYALGLENLSVTHDGFHFLYIPNYNSYLIPVPSSTIVNYTTVSNFHSAFIHIAPTAHCTVPGYCPECYNFIIHSGQSANESVDFTGHKRLYIYPNLIQLDFALGFKIASSYTLGQYPTQYNSIIERCAIETMQTYRTQTSIFGFIKNDSNGSLIVYDELNKPFGLPFWKGGLCSGPYFGRTGIVHPYTDIITTSTYLCELIDNKLHMKEVGYVPLLFRRGVYVDSSEKYVKPFNNRIPVNVVEPLRRTEKKGTLYPEISTKKLRKFNFCFNNGIFRIYCGLSNDINDYIFLKNQNEVCFPPPVIPLINSSIMSFLRGVHILGERGYEYLSFWDGEQDFRR